jgi:hypothetical protein
MLRAYQVNERRAGGDVWGQGRGIERVDRYRLTLNRHLAFGPAAD